MKQGSPPHKQEVQLTPSFMQKSWARDQLKTRAVKLVVFKLDIGHSIWTQLPLLTQFPPVLAAGGRLAHLPEPRA